MECGAYSSGAPFCLSKSNVDPVIGAPLNAFVVLFNRGAAISIIFSATKTLCKKMNVEHRTSNDYFFLDLVAKSDIIQPA